MAEESHISKLLKEIRHQEPPPEYFENFLREFHRRQRAELIQRSTWEILWERFLSLAPSFRVPQLAYAAIAMLAISASAVILTRPVGSPATVASIDPAPRFSLTSPTPVTIGATLPASVPSGGGPLPSHYVLQSRPVSNDQPLSF